MAAQITPLSRSKSTFADKADAPPTLQPHPSRRRRSKMRRALALAAAVAGLAALGAAPAAAAPPYIDPHPDRYTISHSSAGWATAFSGGWFTDVRLESTVQPSHATSNKWKRSAESHVGPGNRRYYTYRNIDNNRCLSQVSGILLTESCVWADNDQWWSTQEYTIPCYTPPGQFPCFPGRFVTLSAWSEPNKVATVSYSSITLTAKSGPHGSPASEQRFGVSHFPAPPW